MKLNIFALEHTARTGAGTPQLQVFALVMSEPVQTRGPVHNA